MARVDDYKNAKMIAAEGLASESASSLAGRSGFKALDDRTLEVPFLDKTVHVTIPDFEFQHHAGPGSPEIPLQEQVLILHYMAGKNPPDLSGKWVSYREIPGASFYYGAFVKRAVTPLKQVFGNNLEAFKSGAEKLKGKPVDNGDAAFEFQVFPHVSIQLILWTGDEEFPAEGNILFDATIQNILSPEDIAWMAGMVVYRLMALSR
ncbi:MAG: DUF3786 domain-containing protein [Desulfobacteraceae bacterium]|nr:DUF3786 domain-containing protein [Desulfobacteraceae bacterium]MBU4001948.1 DUF3786 domain-containing protein [Pseudomonadota bacterium]